MSINRKDKFAIIAIVIIMVVAVSYTTLNIINIFKYRSGKPEDIAYISKTDNKIDYKVYLKQNDYIADQYVKNDLSYISSLIEYINTTFYYNYVGNNDIDVNYTYNIKANIISEYQGEGSNIVSKPIWNKEFVLLDNKTGKSSNSKFTIDDNLNIGIDYYNSLVKAFRESLNVIVVSHLEVKFNVSIMGTLNDGKTFNKEHTMTMNIPLDVKAFDINEYIDFPAKEVIYNKTPRSLEYDYVIAIIYIVGTLLFVWLGIYLIKIVINKKKDKYDLKVSRILREYNDRIITVSNFIKYEKLDIIDISTFNELLELSDETLEPIIYWEKKKRVGKEAWFSILRNKILYRYVYKTKE